MLKHRIGITVLLAGTLVLIVYALLWVIDVPRSNAQEMPATEIAQSNDSCLNSLSFDPNSGKFLSSDTLMLPTQEGNNCYAWQMFIAMNWPTDPGWPATPDLAGEPDRNIDISAWGVPQDASKPMATVPVWGSYKAAQAIFLPNAAKPTGWGVDLPAPSGCQSNAKLSGYATGSTKYLTAVSKSAVNPAHRFHLSTGTLDTQSNEIMEATGGWLTDQDGNLVFFERRVGKAEFDYIVSNSLYDAADQLRVATNADQKNPAGLSLPVGGYLRRPPSEPQNQAELGAFELKAAWRILTRHPEQYQRYLTTVAWLKRPDTGECTQEVIGLVGLHIIHKTDTFPDFIWATFEQVDNVPDDQAAKPPYGYSFNNPDCTGNDCTPNQPRIDCNKDTGCKDLFPRNQPVQVTRVQQTTSALTSLNTDIQNKISRETGGKSVFQYYKLVNVLWDGSPNGAPDPEPGANAKVPLRYGTFESQDSLKVANTTMETYIQNQSCDFCHMNATIAGSTTLASDFSFLFQDAGSAKNPSLVKVIRNVKP